MYELPIENKRYFLLSEEEMLHIEDIMLSNVGAGELDFAKSLGLSRFVRIYDTP